VPIAHAWGKTVQMSLSAPAFLLHKTRIATQALVSVVLATHSVEGADDRASFRANVPLLAVRVSDDDGGRPAAISPGQIKRWVDYANQVYGSTGIHFRYTTSDGMIERKSTLLNNPTGTGDRNWLQFKRAGNQLASEHSGKLTLIFRHGPAPQPTGGGFSWVDYNFVVMPGFEVTTICGRQNIGVLAHEVGHYLGLSHTFAMEFDTVAHADEWLRDHKGQVDSFDGDGLSDTPPDPFIRAIQCNRESSVILQGKKIVFDRRNITGYWYNRSKVLSRQQVEIVKWFVQRRLQSGMLLSANLAWKSPLEAETLEIVERRGVHTNVQRMEQFGVGNWSGDAQLFVGGQPGDALAFALPVAKTDRYQLSAYLTMAPDFVQIQPWLDGERLGDPVDLYAPQVIASGRVNLTTRSFQAGRHTMRIEMVGKGPKSRGNAFGIDCFELAPPDR
jgi:Metallo-peptidase family M12B Reprolysin-like